MQLSKKQEKEVFQVYEAWLHSYMNGDVATYDSYLDDEYHFIGSTNNEEFLSRKNATQFFADTAEQLAGKCNFRNESRIIEKFGELVFITHVFDAWFLNETDWNYYARFRFSNALRKNKAGWRFIYQHFSTPDSKTNEGETIGFEKVHAENQQLREAIQRRTFELEQKNRELEIDTALERIRAQVTSMEKPEDLLDIVVAMRKEFVKLGHEAHYFWHMRWHPDKYEKAMTSGDGTRIGMVMELPRRIHGEIPVLAEWEKGDDPTIIFPMDADAALDYVHKMGSWGDFQRIDPNMPTDDDIRRIGGLTYIMARTSLGEIGYSLPGVVDAIPQPELDIFVRFARAFDLAHKRFEDLKISEQQARETQIELALEKVRSHTMLMQHSDELPQAANHLFLEIQALGVPAASAGYCIWENEAKKSATAFVSSIGELQKPFSLPTKGVGYNFYDPMQRGEKFHVAEILGQEECTKHYEFMRTLPVFGEVLDELFKAGFQIPEQQVFHIVYFPKGYLMFITKESVPHAHDIFKRCANVFEQTYTRFLDLQKAEAQAREIREERDRLEKALYDLQITQKQLIQSEKMASLGELTAGIAHEIQNPLNFVNNFSEVSTELLEEMNEEIENGDLDEVKSISHDIKLNLQKINHHGKRADAIVKGMLLHSRKSTGKKTPTDINKLADEYLRLAYHGLRAKDKSFNAILATAFDPNLAKVMVIAQDIGRVLLNLVTNAFYACAERSRSAASEKKKHSDNGFQPKVTISTKTHLDHFTIAVKDNGNGIPQEVLDKIFQPFFTTKPTGQGTGLGLSLSYDIVKAHGGEIKINTQENEGTVFTILLPLVPEVSQGF